MRYGIEDWAGNRLFPSMTWNAFEDAWGFIYETFDNEEDYQELFVVEVRS